MPLPLTPLAQFIPVEVIMTMIRAIKIDHGTNPECSLFGIQIRYMTNDSNLGVCKGIFGFCWYMKVLYFETHFFGIQDGFGSMVWIGAWSTCFNWCFGLFFGNFLALFVISFWIFRTLCGIFEAIFVLSCQSKGQFFLSDTHVPSSPMPPKIYVVN